MIVTVLSSVLTLIWPLSAPPPPLQYTWYPVTVAGGLQEILKLVGSIRIALRLEGEPAAVSEKEHCDDTPIITVYMYVFSVKCYIPYQLLLGFCYFLKVS